ncbi:MAG: polyribonucleotide nucleotidyltransferase [Rickettsiales bacterium]|jgi:polyribonucleotide nucleotidyltransferase|nr:polyribonucleotide nucleotidyltransferase [Rickettsiales bacterium]
MFNIVEKEITWGNGKLSLETGKIGRQASSVIARFGDTIVMANVTTASGESVGIDFVPLTITYVEKFYAAGQIPPGFVKRETKPSEREVLISRLIDRPVRPLFPSTYRYETNVFCTLLSCDEKFPVEVVASIAASAALTISKAVFDGPTAAVKVGYRDGVFVLNPPKPFEDNGKLDLVVAGTADSVLMVESEIKELSESEMLTAIRFAHDSLKPVIKMIEEFAAECKIDKLAMSEEGNYQLEKEIDDFIRGDIEEAFRITDKQERVTALKNVENRLAEKFIPTDADELLQNKVGFIFKKLEKDVVRNRLLATGKRIDGRDRDQVRPIAVEVDILPRSVVHGSALFTRGETQSICVLTLGSSYDEQIVDGVGVDLFRETFMLHYNFPPYSVGECGKLGAPGRREIGHGKLAWRALNNIRASNEDFPYTIRLVSEITESNGSSSMATVCASSMALMAGGVPMKSPVAGIAMGLVKEKDSFVVLTDIMGDEDFLGDMDFKVAGTREAITALQMDIKCKGVTLDIMKTALEEAKKGRLHILDEMGKAIAESRKELAESAPRMKVMKVAVDKIKDVIGSQGKNIKNITETTKTTIDIKDDGTIRILATSSDSADRAIKMIENLTFEPEIGKIYNGKVVKILDVGAFVQLPNNVDGFVHISELADYRVNFVDDILTENEFIKVKVLGFDKKGKPKLSYREVNQKTGDDLGSKTDRRGS